MTKMRNCFPFWPFWAHCALIGGKMGQKAVFGENNLCCNFKNITIGCKFYFWMADGPICYDKNALALKK